MRLLLGFGRILDLGCFRVDWILDLGCFRVDIFLLQLDRLLHKWCQISLVRDLLLARFRLWNANKLRFLDPRHGGILSVHRDYFLPCPKVAHGLDTSQIDVVLPLRTEKRKDVCFKTLLFLLPASRRDEARLLSQEETAQASLLEDGRHHFIGAVCF